MSVQRLAIVRRFTRAILDPSAPLLVLSFISVSAFAGPTGALKYRSRFLRVELAQHNPAFVTLAVDSLGKGKLDVSPMLAHPSPPSSSGVRRNGQRVEYRPAGAARTSPPSWSFEISARQIRFQSAYGGKDPASPLRMDFDLQLCHATLLGLMNDDGSVRLPALLHLPDHGTFRITSNPSLGLSLGYEVLPYPGPEPKRKFLRVTFPGGTRALPRLQYTLEVVAIYPGGAKVDHDPRFDGFRRNFLNIFQQSPRFRSLANNAASDACAIVAYEYGEVALQTPPLAPGLTALDLLRQTLDRYLGGMKGCGMTGYNAGTKDETGFDFLDAYPSLVIAGADYVLGGKDKSWLRKNYSGLHAWAARMLAFDTDGDGLLEYPQTRQSGPWPWNHPANWWDAIWFTNQDAYSNALAYRACLQMAKVAHFAGKPDDERYYSAHAEKLRSVYVTTFYNPDTGVLAGWKATDGKLHDYYFTSVNGMAIAYGLVPRAQANQIMDRMFAKMKEVGYDRFDLGLPGNLIPVRKEDYNSVGIEWGGPEKDDGSDAFQNYENGGATACFVYYTLDALYWLGRHQEADGILFPLLRSFEDGAFQGRGPSGRTYDWKRWDGTPKGYEGLLADGYLSLLAVLSRQLGRHAYQ
jgi:alpha-L-rhamnosidase-like protein